MPLLPVATRAMLTDVDRPLRPASQSRALPAGPAEAGHEREIEVRALLWVGVAAAVSMLVFVVVHNSLIDDAYITLDYARTLGEHLRWGLTPFHPANSATSPLNVLLLGAVTTVLRHPVLALGVVFTALNMLQMWGLLQLSRAIRMPTEFAVLSFGVILMSPLMLSVVGMEMTLAMTLLVLLADASARGRPKLFGFLTGLLVLARVDMFIFALVLFLASRALRSNARWVVLCAVLTAMPWYVFSWFALGSLLPDTLVFKALLQKWGPWTFSNGLQLYAGKYATAIDLTLIAPLAGVVALGGWFLLRAWRFAALRGLGVVAALGVGGIVHFAAYSVLSPPPYAWYYAPSLGALAIVACAAVCVPRRRDRTPVRARGAYRLAALALPVLLVLADGAFAGTRGVPWKSAPINTNWAEVRQYATLADILHHGKGIVASSPGEIGTLAFFCDCDIVDEFSDRGSAIPLIRQGEKRASALMRFVLGIDLANFDWHQRAAEVNVLVRWRPRPAKRPNSWAATSTWRRSGSFYLIWLTAPRHHRRPARAHHASRRSITVSAPSRPGP